MIFHWNTSNLCIVFEWWRIQGPLSLIATLVAVAALTAGYEAVREASRRYDQKSAEGVNRLPRKFPYTPMNSHAPHVLSL